MPRPLRHDYPGATHHIFVRGVAHSAVAVDAADYERTLFLLDCATSRFELVCHAWCCLPNHSHLLVTSQLGNVSRAMHWLGTCTAQSFNQRHERAGHLYQGRFGSRLVEDDDYFLELGRYLPLNPVRAGLCDSPAEWQWSSYTATAGLRPAPAFLDPGALLGLLGSARAYVDWVDASGASSVLDEFGRPKPPERPPLAEIVPDNSSRSIALAHFRHGYTKSAIARHLGVSRSQVDRRLAVDSRNYT
jgi:REP element-mobilizing transposase RayT